MLLQPISNIAELFWQRHVRNVVISPGSRSAPLTLAFARHPKIKTYVIPDERSAGFIALGIAQNTQEPVGVICTSGTAAVNLFPAVAEAFFQNTPLLLMTADRPPEWIDQWDGQTIYQENLYGRHVKSAYTIPADLSTDEAKTNCMEMISEGISKSTSCPRGPVHFNFPFREPLYPASEEVISYEKTAPLVNENPDTPALNDEEFEKFISCLKKAGKKLILVGQNQYSSKFLALLSQFVGKNNIPIVGDVLSNIHGMESTIRYPDIFLTSAEAQKQSKFIPDLLITFGKSVISKNLKLFLRKSDLKEHWHIQCDDKVRDPFRSSPKILECDPIQLLEKISPLQLEQSPEQESFHNLWKEANDDAKVKLNSFFPKPEFGEFEATKVILDALPENSILHLANSMPVRLANFCGVKSTQKVEVQSNRGTSGIDGCNSTAMGYAITSDKPIVLLTGDMAFLYDRNAFWHNYPFPALRIIVLNNHGGGIFRIIEGPSRQPELEEYFETQQPLKAELTAKEFGMDYYFANSLKDMQSLLGDFFNFDGKPKVLEIETDSEVNQRIFKEFKRETENLI